MRRNAAQGGGRPQINFYAWDKIQTNNTPTPTLPARGREKKVEYSLP
jgi:hypothetical protein